MSQSAKDVLINRAISLFNNGQTRECLEETLRARKRYPDEPFIYNLLGVLYAQIECFEDSIENYSKAIKLNPNYLEAITNLGIVYDTMSDFTKAETYFNKALSLNPTNISVLYNLANCLFNKAITLKEAGQIEEAEENYKRAIHLYPKHIGSYQNLSLIYRDRGQIKEALNIAKEVLKFETNHAEINRSIGLMSLRLGRFKEGWRYYEYRWKKGTKTEVQWPIKGRDVWKGQRGKRVAIWKEQGIGDEIIFLSLIPEVKGMCGSLSVYVDPRLHALCKRSMPGIKFLPNEESLKNEEFDYHLPIQSLGGLLRNDISDFDRTVTGYLKADPHRVSLIRDELQLEGKTVIGISWKSFKSLNELKKSVQLRDMERVFSGLDVVLVNLQYGDVDDEIREFKEATGIEVLQCASVDNREDIDGLAALIEVCDMVVSTSNVTVHLAGALAKETWILLHYVTLYYWLLERTDSIWYPSVTLYRQPELDDWDSVYVSLRKDLEARL